MGSQLIDYFVVLVLGAMIGFVEMLARYKDAPFKVAFSLPGVFYILINALVSALALWGVRVFDLKFTTNPNLTAEMIRWLQVGVAGLAAMILFRSALFTFRVGEKDVSVGPNAILQVLLVAVDKEVDRRRGRIRADIVEKAMDGIPFDRAISNLPPVVLGLMQNLSDSDKTEILRSVKTAQELQAPERAKTMTLGLSFINVVGEDILKAAIDMVNLNEALVVSVVGQPTEKPKETPPVEAPGNAGEMLDFGVEAGEPAPPEPAVDPVVERLREKLIRK